MPKGKRTADPIIDEVMKEKGLLPISEIVEETEIKKASIIQAISANEVKAYFAKVDGQGYGIGSPYLKMEDITTWKKTVEQRRKSTIVPTVGKIKPPVARKPKA